MEEKRKPRLWLMWLAIGLVLLGLYPLTLPPIARLMADGYLPKSTSVVARPWNATARILPHWILVQHYRYQNWWIPDGYLWTGNKARVKPAP